MKEWEKCLPSHHEIRKVVLIGEREQLQELRELAEQSGEILFICEVQEGEILMLRENSNSKLESSLLDSRKHEENFTDEESCVKGY